MILREINFSDYKAIRKVIKKNNLDIYDFKHWKKIWTSNPYYKKTNKKWTKGWVLEINNRIVGCLCIFPMIYDFLGKSYVVAVATAGVVEKQYNNYSILLLKEYFKKRNVDLLFSSTTNLIGNYIYKAFKGKTINFNEYNENIIFVFDHYKLIKNLKILKKINFIILFFKPLINLFSFIINSFYSLIIRNISNKLIFYKSFTNEFDILWNKLKKNNTTFKFRRNKDWLNWHFNYYINNKKIYIVVGKDKNIIIKYCILIEKNNKKLKLKKLCLVDLISLKESNEDYNELIKFSINLAKQKKYDYLEIVGFNSSKRKILKKYLPIYRKFKYSRFCYFAPNEFLSKKLNNRNNLDFSMIDGDAIL